MRRASARCTGPTPEASAAALSPAPNRAASRPTRARPRGISLLVLQPTDSRENTALAVLSGVAATGSCRYGAVVLLRVITAAEPRSRRRRGPRRSDRYRSLDQRGQLGPALGRDRKARDGLQSTIPAATSLPFGVVARTAPFQDGDDLRDLGVAQQRIDVRRECPVGGANARRVDLG